MFHSIFSIENIKRVQEVIDWAHLVLFVSKKSNKIQNSNFQISNLNFEFEFFPFKFVDFEKFYNT